MIQVTDRAARGLEEILSSSRAASDQAVKLVPADTGGIGMTIGSASENDLILDGDRKPLLIIDSGVIPHLDGAVIDRADTDDTNEPQFVIRRQEATDPS